MYEEFYGLKRRAFENTPNPEFFFASNQHREALASLVYGVEYSKGFVLVTGDVGTGKTFLSHALKYELGDEHIVVEVTTPWITTEELVQALPEKLEMEFDPEWSALTLQERLKARLAELHEQGRRVLIILDEAQQLPLRTLEGIRLLSNLETPDAKVIQIILFGQNELNEIINRHSMRQIRQRITLCRSLVGLDRDDTRRYVAHRLAVAGRSAPLFSDESLQLIYQYSRGVPRLINLICDNCLITGFAHQAAVIEADVVREVVADLPISSVSANAVTSSNIGDATAEAEPAAASESASGKAEKRPKGSEDLLEAFLEGAAIDELEEEEEIGVKAEKPQPEKPVATMDSTVRGLPIKQLWLMLAALLITILLVTWMLTRPTEQTPMVSEASDPKPLQPADDYRPAAGSEAPSGNDHSTATIPDDLEALVRELEQQALTASEPGMPSSYPEVVPSTQEPLPVVAAVDTVQPLPFSDGIKAPETPRPVETQLVTVQPGGETQPVQPYSIEMPLANSGLYKEYALPPGSTLSQLVRQRYSTWNDSSRDLIQALNPILREGMDRLSANARLNLPDISRKDLLTQDNRGDWMFWAGTTSGNRKSKSMADDYRNQGFEARVVEGRNHDGRIYRVYVGPFDGRDNALIAVSRIKLNSMPFIR